MKLALLSIFCCPILIAHSAPTEYEVLPKENYLMGYNPSAQIHLEQKKWEPDLFFDLSFLYYYAGEEGLDLATSAGLISSGAGGPVVVATQNSTGLTQKFEYKPGFKVGCGVEHEEWTTNAEYTWIRQITSTNQAPKSPGIASQSAVWFLNNWFQQTTAVGQTISATSLSSDWHLSMDLLDLNTSRPFYQARNLIISPFGGIRSAWIRQKLNMQIAVPSAVVSVLTSSPVYSNNSSNSWSLGPRTGCESAFLLGRGFKVIGKAALALLFTQYTTIAHEEQVASALASPSVLKTSLKNINCLRPELDLNLGIGWSSYLAGKKYFIDFSASYEFLLFWNQNMMRKLGDQTIAGTGSAPGDLFLQGLDLRGSFHF